MSGPERKWTVESIAAAIVANHGVFANAAKDLGITGARVSQIVRAHPELRALADSLIGDVIVAAKTNIVQAILDGDLKLSVWWLEKRDPDFKPDVWGGTGGDGRVPVYNSPSSD